MFTQACVSTTQVHGLTFPPSCSSPSFTAALYTSVISLMKWRKTDETDNDDGSSGHPVDTMQTRHPHKTPARV